MKTRVLLFAIAVLATLGSTACVVIRPKDLPDYRPITVTVASPK